MFVLCSRSPETCLDLASPNREDRSEGAELDRSAYWRKSWSEAAEGVAELVAGAG